MSLTVPTRLSSRHAFAAASATLLAAMHAQAQTVWTGATGTASTANDWNVAANWSPADIPNTNTEIALFNDTVLAPHLRNVDFSASTVNGLTFNSSAQSFHGNTGNAANINYAGTNGFTLTGAVNLTLSGTTPTITQSGAGNVLMDPIVVLPAALALAGNGTGQVVLNRFSGSSTITKTGNSNYLVGSTTSPGATTKWIVNGGQIRANSTSQAGGPASLDASWLTLNGGQFRIGTSTSTWGANRGVQVGNSTANTIAFGGVSSGTILTLDAPIADVSGQAGKLRFLGGAGQGVIKLTGTNTYTGATTVENANVLLDYTTGTAADNRLSNGGLTLSGGRLALTGNLSTAVTEQVGNTTLANGFSTIYGYGSGTEAATTTLQLGSITRSDRGVVGFAKENSFYVFNTTSSNNFTGTSGGILGGWATTGAVPVDTTGAYTATDWASVDGSGNIIALAAYDTNSVATNANSLINATQTVSANTTINSLLSNTTAAHVNINAGVELKIASGGVLWRSTATGMNIGNVAGQGTLTSGNGRDLIFMGDGGTTTSPTINAVITDADAGATPIGLTVAIGAARTVTLAANNTFTGPVNILSGLLQLGTGATADVGDGTVINIGKAGVGNGVDPAQLRFASGQGTVTKTLSQDINVFGNHNNATQAVRTGTGSFANNGFNLNLDGNITVDTLSATIDAPTVAVLSHDRNLNSAVRLGGATVGAKVLQGSATPGQNVVAVISTNQLGIRGNSLAGGITSLGQALTINSTIQNGTGGGGLTTNFDGGVGGIAVVKINGNNTYTGAGTFGNGIQPGTNLRNTIALAGHANAFGTGPINLGVVTGAVASNQKQGVLTDAGLTIANNIGLTVDVGGGTNGALIAESFVGGNTAANSTFSGRIGWQFNGGTVPTSTGYTNNTANFAASTHALVLSQVAGGRSTFTGEIASNNNTASAANAALSSVIIASGGEVKLSNNANSYVGKTIVRNGTLLAGANGALGTATTDVQLGDTRTVATSGASVRVAVSSTPAGTFTFNPTGGTNGNGALTWTAGFNSSDNPFDGVTLVANDLVLLKDFAGTNTAVANAGPTPPASTVGTGNPALNGIYKVMNVGASTAVFERVASVDSNYGTYVDVTAGNTYAGRRFYQGYGGTGTAMTLNSTPQSWQLDDTTYNAALLTEGATSLGRNITVNAGSGTRTLGGASNENSTFTGAIALGKDTALTSVATGANRTAFSGVISGTGAISKTGVGTVNLTNANTYGGGTTVSVGTLLVNNVSGSGTGTGPVSVVSGATLGGSGIISGAATVSSGAFLSPGNSPGNLTFDNGLTLAGTYVWELAALSTSSPGVNFDTITVTSGNVDITGASMSLNLGSFAPSADPFWQSDQTWAGLINNTGAGSVTGTFVAIDNTAWASLGSFSTSVVGNDVNLVWTAAAVPEPSSFAALAGLGAAGFAALRRRRR